MAIFNFWYAAVKHVDLWDRHYEFYFLPFWVLDYLSTVSDYRLEDRAVGV
jgi:hypothetical protein